MSLLAALLLTQAAAPVRPIRAWQAHEGVIGTVLPLSSGAVLTAGHFGDETLRIWSPDGVRTFDRKLSEPLSWAFERGGPDDLVLGLNKDLLSLRDGHLKTFGRMGGMVEPAAGDPPRRVFWTAPGDRLIESRPDGRRIARPRADAIATHGGWIATIRDERLWIEDPRGRVTSAPCPVGPLEMALDAPSRTVVIHDTERLPTASDSEWATHRLAAYDFAGKRRWKRTFPNAAAGNLTLLGPYAVVTISRAKPLRADISFFRLADGATLAFPDPPPFPNALGADPARRRLAVGIGGGEVRLYEIKAP